MSKAHSQNKPSRRTRRTSKDGILTRILAGASIVSVVLLWACALSVYIHPASFKPAGVMGLAFPFILAGVLMMQVLMLVFAFRRSWIPAVGMLLCAGTIRTYFPINFPSIAPKGCVKVMTYNVCNWGHGDTAYTEDKKHNLIAQYMAQSEADIICIQEGTATAGFYEKYARPELTHTPHMDSISLSSSRLVMFSAYPIVKKQRICHNTFNGSGAFWVVMEPGDTLIVINNHLQSNHLDQKDREGWSRMVKQPKENISDSVSLSLYHKITESSVARANMADSIAQFIEDNKHHSILVCGDFNDSPICYAHHRIASGLKDVYARTANGIGRTFTQDAIYVRIDHILCSRDWKPYQCAVDNTCYLSDHFPVTCYLKRNK